MWVGVCNNRKKAPRSCRRKQKCKTQLLYVTHQDENGYWINVLLIGAHMAPKKTLLHLKKQKQCTLLTPSWAGEREEGRMKGASLKKLFSPLSCAPMEQNPCQIPDEGKKSCNFLPLNMLAGGLAAQLASHKQQWHNNDSNNNSNDNNDRNYDKNHNTAAATDAVANLFFWRGALKWHNSIAITRSQMS